MRFAAGVFTGAAAAVVAVTLWIARKLEAW